jgi:hypothetical protein
MLSARRQFLDAFLGALGAADIVDYVEQADAVTGAVRYAADSEVMDLSGDEGDELQPFVWRISEEEAPSLLTYRIAEILERYRLLELDRLRVSRATLLSILQNDTEQQIDPEEFAAALDALLQIEVPMVENGEETDDTFRIWE